MGDVLSCVSDAADAAGTVKDATDASNVIDSDVLAGIAQAAIDACTSMPETYAQVKSDLIWNMWHESPNPYEEEFTKTSLVWKKTKKSEVSGFSRNQELFLALTHV